MLFRDAEAEGTNEAAMICRPTLSTAQPESPPKASPGPKSLKIVTVCAAELMAMSVGASANKKTLRIVYTPVYRNCDSYSASFVNDSRTARAALQRLDVIREIPTST